MMFETEESTVRRYEIHIVYDFFFSSLVTLRPCRSVHSYILLFEWCRYMGTVTGIGDLDPVRWPNSHWRSLKVRFDVASPSLNFGAFIKAVIMNITFCCSILERTSTITEHFFALFTQVGWDESTAGERQRRVSLWEIEPLTTPFLMCPPPIVLRSKRARGIHGKALISRRRPRIVYI